MKSFGPDISVMFFEANPYNKDAKILVKYIGKHWHGRSPLSFLHWAFVEHLNYVKFWIGDAGDDQHPQEFCRDGTVPHLYLGILYVLLSICTLG